MVELKKFVAVYLAILVVGSALIIGWTTLLNSSSLGTEARDGHFSVVWMGFKPTYKNEYPDYYVCINNLKDDSLQMQIQLKIENYEDVSLYFLIQNHTEPPAGWFVGTQYLGYIAITDPIKTFTYSNLNRTKPASISEGSLHESVELVVKAYYDAGYSQFYSQDNFIVNFHFIDVTSAAWTRVEYYNFDDGTRQGWTGGSLHSYFYYRSWPYSIQPSGGGPYKDINMIGNYSEAYLVAATYCNPSSPVVYFDGLSSTDIYFGSDMPSVAASWRQITVPLPLNRVTRVFLISIGSYIDDIYVLAKP